jgi:hypothetical protein
MQTIIILLLLENELIEISSVSANEYEKHLEIWTGDQQAGEDGNPPEVLMRRGQERTCG